MMYAGATLEEAEDAVSPAMAQAYARWPVLTHPSAWVRRVALRNYLKKVEKDRRRGHAETAASRLNCLDRSSVGEHEEPDERGRVIAALRCLPPAQLTAMALTFDGYTPTEIAQTLHQDARTVRSNLRHARKRLRDEIENPAGRQAIVAGKGERDQG
jgi:RNA polymerase sigma-70 factor (ECF subfamily)